MKIPHFILNCFRPRIDAQDSVGKTELLRASERGDYEIVNELLDKGANVNLIDDYGVSALTVACLRGHMRIVKLLVENGADVNFTSEKRTPLIEAARSGNYHIVKYLLKNGSNIKCEENNIILFYALENIENTKIVKFLIYNGAQVNIHGRTSLDFALMLSKHGKHVMPSIKLLLTRNSFFEEKDIPTDIILKPIFQAANIVDKLSKNISLENEDKEFLNKLIDKEIFKVMVLRFKYKINNGCNSIEDNDIVCAQLIKKIEQIAVQNNNECVAVYCNKVIAEAKEILEEEKLDIINIETSMDNTIFVPNIFIEGIDEGIYSSNAKEQLLADADKTNGLELSGIIDNASGVGVAEYY